MAIPTPDRASADARTLYRAARRHRLSIVLGAILALLGGAYGAFAAEQFGSPRVHEGFDRPVARLALVVQGCGAERRQFEPETVREAELLADLERHAATSGHLVVLLVRVLLASMLLGAGLAGLAAGVSEGRLVRAFARLGVDLAGPQAAALRETPDPGLRPGATRAPDRGPYCGVP